jgi:putative flippase GtrA
MTGRDGRHVIVRQALRFAAVGVLGFLVDAGVLMATRSLPGLNLYSGRAVSFLAAVTATWALNRSFTFKEHASPSMLKEWVRFCAANALGGAVNLGVYAWLVNSVSLVHNSPVLGVAAGSLSGLAVNFTLSRVFVFRAHRPMARLSPVPRPERSHP